MNIVSIWTGHFPGKERLDSYMREEYDDEGDMTSEFMASYGIDFIDNQFQEVQCLSEHINRETLIGPLSYSASFIDQVHIPPGTNSVIALYDFEYTGAIETDKYTKFIGTFSYHEDSAAKELPFPEIYLMIPIFELYHISSAAEIIFNDHVVQYLKDHRSLSERKKIYIALRWAVNNPGYNYIRLMKKAPEPGTLKFSNEEIHQYLLDHKLFMEDSRFGLLTDDRPPLKMPGTNE